MTEELDGFTVRHVNCDKCLELARAAKGNARATGSVGARVESGDHAGAWSR